MLHNKYKSNKTSSNFEKFRKQRNLVTSLKQRSMSKYFIDRCVGGCKSTNFLATVKPFLTNKGSNKQKDTILCENETLINDQS